MSTQKRSIDEKNEPRKGAKKKPNIPEALGIVPIVPNYKPYSIKNWIGKDKKTKKNVVHKNEEKTSELLDFLLNLGNANSFKVKTDQEAEEAINTVFDRDHDWGDGLLKGLIKVEELGTLAIPEIFCSKVPDVLDYNAFPTKRATEAAKAKAMLMPPIERFPISDQGQNARYTHENNVPLPKDHERCGGLSGDKWERLLFYALKKYFEDTKDACLIIHGHSFLHEDNFKEKDFIILNLSKGYIMNIEVKASHKQFDHAKEQIKDCRKRIQAVLDSIPGMSSIWKFVGVCGIGDGFYNHDFIINGSDLESNSCFDRKLDQIEKILNSLRLNWNPSQDRIKEFVSIGKHLLFIAQGDSKALLTKEKLAKKVDEDLDKASAPENILFWTPEQLSIVQAMHIDWMCLMSYYGCGKTILLIERAEYLLRNPRNTVYFYVDKEKSGLTEVLKLRFDGRNVHIKEKAILFEMQSIGNPFDLLCDGIHPTDHVIIDEATLSTSELFLRQLMKFKSQVSSLWVALGDVGSNSKIVYGPHANFNESYFRKALADIQFHCPTLKHCLRNGQKIVELAKEADNQTGLNCFAPQVEVKSKSKNVIDGLCHIMPLIYPNPITALQEAFKVHHSKKYFVFMDNQTLDSSGPFGQIGQSLGLEMSTLEEAISGHYFFDFQNREALNNWLKSSSMNQHLVLQDYHEYHFEVSGMEFQSMIYLSLICLKCAYENKHSSVITRAKASLLLARYEKQNCKLCQNWSYPNLKWNKEYKKWEIEQGYTKDQLPEASRQIFEKTSKLTSQLFKP